MFIGIIGLLGLDENFVLNEKEMPGRLWISIPSSIFNWDTCEVHSWRTPWLNNLLFDSYSKKVSFNVMRPRRLQVFLSFQTPTTLVSAIRDGPSLRRTLAKKRPKSEEDGHESERIKCGSIWRSYRRKIDGRLQNWTDRENGQNVTVHIHPRLSIIVHVSPLWCK